MVEDRRAPAPDALSLVQDFINTADLAGGPDELSTPEALTAWLRDRELLRGETRTDAADLTLALEVREALRDLAFANNSGIVAAKGWQTLNRVASEAELRVCFGPVGAGLQAEAQGVLGSLGRLLAIVYASIQDGTWRRLKACRDTSCRWAFYDHSKNRSSAWCTMAECGNRAKTRTYRRRVKNAGASRTGVE